MGRRSISRAFFFILVYFMILVPGVRDEFIWTLWYVSIGSREGLSTATFCSILLCSFILL